MWIGANDIFREGQLRWASTNQRVLFSNWYVGEPNNAGSADNEDCVQIKKSQSGIDEYRWNDVSCTYSYYYVCEK